jgi:hypothetical protein
LSKHPWATEDSIRAEEFSGFTMGHNDMLMPKRKSHLLVAAIGLMIIIAVIVHAGAVISIFNAPSLKNLSYFTIGLILVIILFKVFAIFKLKHFLEFQHRKKR